MELFTHPDVLVECLLRLDTEADNRGWGASPTLLVVHEGAADPDGDPMMRNLTLTDIPMQEQVWQRHPGGVPGVLGEVAASLTYTESLMATHVAGVAPAGSVIIGWVVVYEDVHACPQHFDEVRRIEAVDIDIRWYRMTRARGYGEASVVVDHGGDHGDQTPIQRQLCALMRVSRDTRLHGWPL